MSRDAWWRYRRDRLRGMSWRGWVLRLVGTPCGSYGGVIRDGARWCWKTYGHPDSCAFTPGGEQPLDVERRRARGWVGP